MNIILPAYLKCALWSSTQDDGLPFDRNFEIKHFSLSAIQKANKEIKSFLADLKKRKIDWQDMMSETALGHDLWLTRNGHGTGFWDRDLHQGDALTACAHLLGKSYVYQGNDGELHFH